MNLDSLKYGALNRQQVLSLSRPTPFFACDVGDLPLVAPMKNSDPRVRREIEFVNHVMKRKPLPDDFMKLCDRDLLAPFHMRLAKIGAPPPLWLEPLAGQVESFVVYLKEHYQRARPSQLAPYIEMNFMPEATLSGHSPAYPSGHSAQAIVVALALQKAYGKHGFLELAKAISLSRLQLGVHYPSDKKYGEYLGYWLFKRCTFRL